MQLPRIIMNALKNEFLYFGNLVVVRTLNLVGFMFFLEIAESLTYLDT